MSAYKSGSIIKQKSKKIKCCLHKNLVPLEIGLARKTWPNGYSAEPYYNFATNVLSADVLRVRSYICLDCKCEIKAPKAGQLKKDIL